MSGSLAQFGAVDEVTYGTAVAVTKWFEASKEAIAGSYDRVQADALSASLFDRADRFAVAPKGAAGDFTLEVLSKGFGFWLKHMMGAVASTADGDDAAVYHHVGTPANLFGKSFTLQVGRPTTNDTIIPWTYSGGKITKWELSNSVDGTLQMVLSMDFQGEDSPTSPTGAFALQTPSLPTGAEVLTWQKGTLNIGGVEVDVTDVDISCDNGLKVDRYYIRSNTRKKEPVGDSKRAIEWSFSCDFDNNDLNALVRAADAAGAMTSLTAEWQGLVLAGDTLYPGIKVEIPAVRFDEGAPAVDGPSMLTQSFSGVGLDNGTDDPITVTYTSVDTTV